ncbi:MAG: hypothetical protein AAB845_03030 [Patescibacteria group bacterium]
MDQELEARLKAQDEKLDAIYVSVERTRKYFLFTMVSTLVFFLVPIIGLAFAIPAMLNTLNETTGLINSL